MFAQTLYQIKWNTTIRRNLCIFLFFLVKLVTFISFWTERIIICRFVYWWNANGKRKTVWYYTITKVVSCCASLRFANYSFFYCCYVPGNETKTMSVYRRMAHHCQPSNSNKKKLSSEILLTRKYIQHELLMLLHLFYGLSSLPMVVCECKKSTPVKSNGEER